LAAIASVFIVGNYFERNVNVVCGKMAAVLRTDDGPMEQSSHLQLKMTAATKGLADGESILSRPFICGWQNGCLRQDSMANVVAGSD
jgi:hypothetical protein